ncbi:3-methyladenine DNA glycosylase AlkD [Sporosarcina luteola]|nr:3-methyladenine DNA glycosylase AlkD [Sporosarcina luteola]
MKRPWDHKRIVEKFDAHRNEELAGPMEAYMKHQFPFLGIKSPLRKELLREQFAAYDLPLPEELFTEAWKLYHLPEREYQYAAIGLIEKMRKHLTTDNYSILRELIETKAWWDSVDSIAPTIVGHIVRKDRALGEQTMWEWANSDNLWVNRSAILHQLKYKGETDTDLLFKMIRRHADSHEFFIQKAIGWVLREYAKTNPQAVKTFVRENTLKPLSRREALKHIGND